MNATLASRYEIKERQPLTERRAKLRREIIDVGAALFAERGIDPVSVEDILDGAGISRRTFYMYFASKDDLLVSILTPTLERGVDLLRGVHAKRPADVISKIIDVYVELWREHALAFYVTTYVTADQFKLIERVHVAFVRELHRLIAPFDGSRALRGRSVEHTNNLLFRCAIPMLKVYGDDEQWEELYRASMRDLLLPGAKSQ